MIGPRRLITMSLGLLPLAAGAALQQPASTNRPEVGGPQARVTNPHGAISVPCQNCHTYSSWKPIRAHPEFNHDQTGYPLRGMHEKVGCTECHTNLVFAKVSTLCADCHADIHRGQFGANCESCHTVKGWEISRNAIRDHQNRFPLVGAHALVECDACHKNAAAGQFVGLSTACYSCHQQDFKTTVVDHVNLGFPTTCDSCHTMDTWFNAKFDHLKYTGYALTGVHATLACTACHINNVFAGTPSDCYSCHRADFAGTTSPPHVQLAFPRDCQTCHTTSGWNPAKFDHNTTSFPLTGAHVNVSCSQCHVNNNYTSLPTACYGCHQADFTGTTNPNHVDSGFPTDCTLCHTTTAWNPSTFNHASVFPLTGAHAKLTCTQCHTNNNYTTLPTNCFGCHQADWNSTSNPNHAAAAFPTTCNTCHSTSNWTTVTFNHATYANYPLTGAHATLTCVQCHVNNNYVNTPTACYSCHQADFASTTSPNHVSSGFPTDCSICHTTSGWSPSSFDHASVFPLTGAHATLSCTQCHTNNNWTTLPTNCSGCHQADWNGTTDPNHPAAGFPTTCDTCHTTTAWTGAAFNHNNTLFPLTGAHVSVDCVKCHVNNVYAGTPTDCYSCHSADYSGTTDPNHSAAGWPTTCTTCHTTTGWVPATLPASYHTFFPLKHGNANGVCATCHTNSADYSVFQCTGCHGGNNAANFRHPNVSGYVYNSVNCYACHKNGGGD